MFKNKICKIKFRKVTQRIGRDEWKEVANISILSVLEDIQEKYNFDILKIQLENCVNDSKIIIKCKKEDKQKIFMEFCMRLNDQIERVSI